MQLLQRTHTWMFLRWCRHFIRRHCALYFSVKTCEYMSALDKNRQLHQRNCCVLELTVQLLFRTLGSRRAQGNVLISACAKRMVRCQLGCARLMCKQHLDLSPSAQTDMLIREDCCCVLSSRAHLDLPPCAKMHAHAKSLLHSRADLTPCAKKHVVTRRDCYVPMPQAHFGSLARHVHAQRLLLRHSDVAGTHGFLPVHKTTYLHFYSSRLEHRCVSLHAQRNRDM